MAKGVSLFGHSFIEERTRTLFDCEQLGCFIVTGVAGSDGDKPSIPVKINDTETIIIPNYDVQPNYSVSTDPYCDLKAFSIAVPYNALSADELKKCKSAAKSFNEQARVEISFGDQNGILRLHDKSTDRVSTLKLSLLQKP